MKTKSHKRFLIGLSVLLKHRIPTVLMSIDFFATHENSHPVKALAYLKECFYHLSKSVISENIREKFNCLNSAFDCAEEASLEPWRLQFNWKMKKILMRRKVMKYLGLVLILRKISLKEIDKSLAMSEEYRNSAERNRRALKDRINDYNKAYYILNNIEKKIPGLSDYLERIFEIILMLLGIVIGVLIEKYLLH